MADVVVTGAGMNGLATAMLLAGDGHRVTVLERDGAPPPRPEVAWDGWERRGVNQFRLLHYLLPRWRELVEAELPGVAAAFDAAGATRYDSLARIPAEITGGPRPGDEELVALTARRPVAESVMAAVAESAPGVEVRRGVAVRGLRTGASAEAGIPHVTGVVTEQGDELPADLVVDTTGRRSPLPAWVAALGGRPPAEVEEDSGFVYYGRHFRSADGSLPALVGPLLQQYDSMSVLTLPADNGTWGVGVIASSGDGALRALRDDDTWDRVVRRYPLVAHWADGEPLDSVAVMANIPDRRRWFVVDGRPVATGVVALGDSWACTNPSLGRGITIGLLHALALRELVRSGQLDDPVGFALAWQDMTDTVVGPWYESTLWFDRHRLAEIQAEIAGVPYAGDESWSLTRAMMHAAGQDPDILRGFMRVVGLLDDVGTAFGRPGFLDKVVTLGAGWEDAPPMGPNRSELLSLVAG